MYIHISRLGIFPDIQARYRPCCQGLTFHMSGVKFQYFLGSIHYGDISVGGHFQRFACPINYAGISIGGVYFIYIYIYIDIYTYMCLRARKYSLQTTSTKSWIEAYSMGNTSPHLLSLSIYIYIYIK